MDVDRASSVAAMFLAQAARQGDRPLLRTRVDGRWHALSWQECAHAVANVAAQLVANGLEPGTCVALLSPNRPEWLLADLASLAAALVDVPIYATSPAADVVALLRRARCAALFVADAAQFARIAPSLSELPLLRLIVVFEPGDVAAVRERAAGREVVAFGELASVDHGRAAPAGSEREVRRRLELLRPTDLATLLFTSGTTGEPKGVMLTHGNLLENCRAILRHVPLGPDDQTLSFLPLSHAFERTAGHYALLMAGGAIAYATSTETVAAEIREVRPTLVLGVPRFFEKVHDRILGALERAPRYRRELFAFALRVADEVDHARATAGAASPLPLKLRFRAELAERLVFSLLRRRLGGRLRFFVSGGAPLDPELVTFFGRLGLPVLQGYGLTETAPVVSCTQLGAVRPGSVGTILPGVEVRIADDGEILVRGPNVMVGYRDDPTATAAVLEPDGTFRTGDLGHFDADGHLFITDRKKELIIGSGGKNVAPARIEALLKRHRVIGDACVLGDRRPYLVALLVPDESALKPLLAESGAEWTSRTEMTGSSAVRQRFAAAIDAVNAQLAPPERVRRFLLLPEPFSIDNGQLTPTLKVRRREIERRFRAELDALYAER